MKKEFSEEDVRNQYVSENEYLKSSINRASLGRSGRPLRGMKGSRSHEKQENNEVGGSGDGGTGSVMEYIRKYENGDTDSSSDDDNDVDVDDSNDDDDDDDSNCDDSNGLGELELQVGDSIDNSVSEEIINNRKKVKVIYDDNSSGNIIKIENSVEKEKDEIDDIEEEEVEGEEIDGVENMPLSTSPYKSILEEFEEMENENMSSKEIKNIMNFSTTEIEDEDDIEVEIESSHLEKSFSTPKGDFEYNKKVVEKGDDNNKIDDKINLEQILPEIKNDLNNQISSNSDFLNQLDEDSDDYLLLHRNNVDDVLQNLLNDFKINIKSKTSNKKANNNISKSELKNTKEKKKSSSKKILTIIKEIDISHPSPINKMDKKKTKKNQKNFSSEKKKSSTQIIFHDQEKKELSINHFNSIFSHKKTILCFTLAITIHYFIFSGISKLV